MPENRSLITKYRVICLGALTIELAWLVWLWWHALPLPSLDASCFKQPAYMGLFSDSFKIPTFAGRYPHVYNVFGYPSTVFTFANFAWFSVFGFDVYTSLAFDFAVHLAIVGMLGWGLSRALDNPWLVALGMLGASHIILPVGRPEELAILLVMGALAAVWGERKYYALAIGLLGCCGTTAPFIAVGGVMLCYLFDLFGRPWRPATALRLAGLYALSLPVAIAVYVATTFPYTGLAIEQITAAWGKTPRQSLAENLRNNTLWGGRLIVASIGVILGGYAAFKYRAHWPAGEPRWATFLRASSIVVPILLVMVAALGRQTYDYRLIHLIIWAGLLVTTDWAIRTRIRGFGKVAAYAFLVFMAVLPHQMPIRHLLMPLTWGDDAVSYDRAYEAVHTVVPQGSSIGGDPELWTFATDGRPYYAFGWVGKDYYPDFMLTCESCSLSNYRGDEIRELYDELPTSLPEPKGKSTLRLGSFAFDVAKTRTDFCVRVWRKKTLVHPKELDEDFGGEGAEQSPETTSAKSADEPPAGNRDARLEQSGAPAGR